MALTLLRTFGTESWEQSLAAYFVSVPTLKEKYAGNRLLLRLPLTIDGEPLTLSPGGQNVLVKEIVESFAPRFTPGGQFVYVGDTDEKFARYDSALLSALGVTINEHGKMPDLVILYTAKNWLILVEAVVSHGPVNPKRKAELKTLFGASAVGLVFVTAFLDRSVMRVYLPEIAWETEVWVAEDPDHLIHFNGERFLGPYEGG